MKIAIRYLSKSKKQNGVKLATAVSDECKVVALPITEKLEEEADVLFLINAMYGFTVDPDINAFIEKNANNIKCLVNINSSCSGMSTLKAVKKIATKYSVKVSENEYHTKGSFGFMNKNRPNQDDLNKLKEFVKGVIAQ
ncbi:MAG: flavodoxin [Bacilli bacterium]|nr:flavodoxin [Bacilli bacterium]